MNATQLKTARPADAPCGPDRRELNESWRMFLRSRDDHFAHLAAKRHKCYLHLAEEEIDAAARLAAAFGLRPPA